VVACGRCEFVLLAAAFSASGAANLAILRRWPLADPDADTAAAKHGSATAEDDGGRGGGETGGGSQALIGADPPTTTAKFVGCRSGCGGCGVEEDEDDHRRRDTAEEDRTGDGEVGRCCTVGCWNVIDAEDRQEGREGAE